MTGYEYAQARRQAAFVTVTTHPDAATRERAVERVHQWTDVVSGMASGTLQIGSRTPIDGVPGWATPTVVRGGFATGDLEAGGPLTEHELALAGRHGLPAERAALFRHALSPAGMAELDALLVDGCYRADITEETALLTVAWLHRVGEHEEADRLVAEIRPWADRLRFLPRPAAAPVVGNDVTSRTTVYATRAALLAREVNPRVAAMREALGVWLPLRDDLHAHWRATIRDGRLGAHRPPSWLEASRVLLARYDDLAARHRRCRKHRDPRENLAIMLRVLRAVLDGDERELPLLATRLARMSVAPPERSAQAAVMSRPTHPQLARVVAGRLEDLPPDEGLSDPEAYLGPVTPDELGLPGSPGEEAVPAPVVRIVRRARRAAIDDLVADGTVPSAEVLAELTPSLTAAAVAADAPDDAARTLLETGLRAFATRRSLLLTGLASQVRTDEVPWLAAVQNRRRPDADPPGLARLRALGELVVRAFPGTPAPNPLVDQFGVLARSGGEQHPFVPELAADIFEGHFARSFARAASLASELLEGTLYTRYYDLRPHDWSDDTGAFTAACWIRAGRPGSDVPGNGAVIEQAQVLTTHNLAVLVGPVGVRADWDVAADRALAAVVHHLTSALTAPSWQGGLRSVKQAAAAWRQMVFHLSAAGPESSDAFLARPHHETVPAVVAEPLRRLIAGLAAARDRAPRGTRAPRSVAELSSLPFLGWAPDGEHPILMPM